LAEFPWAPPQTAMKTMQTFAHASRVLAQFDR
jgi:hypothetical protein